MSFAIFDETFYLNSYPDVQNAVNAGLVPSGFNHFQALGLSEGRVLGSPFYNEAAYLSNNPDVAAAVSSGAIASGLQHFIFFGEQEGRVSISPEWNEGTYLALNPDVASAVNSGVFASGLQHFLAFGEAENRPGAPSGGGGGGGTPATPAGFSEQAYLALYPDIRAAVAEGVLSSGLTHYERFGQFEPTRSGFFFGTAGNDVINAFGESTGIIGIGFDNITPLGLGSIDGVPRSLGVGEVDTLIGGSGEDLFSLGLGITPLNPTAQKLYVGNRTNDFAQINNFDVNEDLILLAGNRSEYTFEVGNGNFIISTNTGDLIAVVQGVTDLQVTDIFNDGTFLLSGGNGTSFAFNESIYLAVNTDVAAAVNAGNVSSGFAHYQQFGQFEGRVGVFSGTSGNDVVSGFGQNTTIVGVDLAAIAGTDGTDVRPLSLGNNEIDTLIGDSGTDTFILATGRSPANDTAQPLYLGGDNADFAIIENFDAGRDRIQLAGTLADYTLQVSDGSLSILQNPGDLVAIVPGVTTLQAIETLDNGTFLLG
ncbi:hypothetical protein [Phormidium sp. CCY1219]|uniref:hypothetical protein n=1 Tax=Phormidium sp. CCY1219 TaxID=2886104 RepID=UPI002D1ED1EE|nr:hypothetical protein [Phormidium sp. CCY1219]MEB3830517.1 hypothetical protein [Phormidium sp. CCY1219]